MEPIKIFISYSRRDVKRKDDLIGHLTPMERQGLARIWHDRLMDAGAEWRKVVMEELNNAAIILLLISHNFISSEFCYEIEMPRALERSDAGGATVIPIILSWCDWEKLEFARLNSLPRNRPAVFPGTNSNKILTGIVKEIRESVEDMLRGDSEAGNEEAPPNANENEERIGWTVEEQHESKLDLEPSDDRDHYFELALECEGGREDIEAVEKLKTDTTGRVFMSYRRSRVAEITLLLNALHDRGVPTWQDVANLEMGQAEESLRKTLSDLSVSGGILWLTPDVADSAMITKVEMPEILNRSHNSDDFFALLVAAGGLDYNGVADLGKGHVPFDLGEFNIERIGIDPVDHNGAARVARRVLRQRIEGLHKTLPLDQPLAVTIHTGTPPPFTPGKALIVDWTHRFLNGRTALPGVWADFLIPALKDIVEAIQTEAPGRPVEATGRLSIPSAVALGCALMETRGIGISWRPQQASDQLWHLRQPRQVSGFVSRTRADRLTGEDLAVLVSVDNNVSPGFTRSKPNLAAEFRAISEIRKPNVPSGVTRYEIKTPGEAADIAYTVRQAIVSARNEYPEIIRTHLFMAVPVGLAMMIGQLLNTCGLIQTYEYHADKPDCPYEPAVLLNPTW